ncbi:MAG: class I SAM-dependent methyltransferase [Bacteroidetes bacterium]|nr:class I SAM-dependent methyltransferase [Bacteroidota bacterium]
MEDPSQPKGILSGNYALERKNKPELIFRYKTRARVVVNSASRYLKKSKGLHVLDMGSAEGLTLQEMDRLMPESDFIGIEFSKELIESASYIPFNIKIIQGDVTCLPAELPRNFYDIVSALALLEHLNNPVKAIQEAYEVLKPGGIFVATCPVPSWDNLSNKIGLLKEDHHESDMYKKELVNTLQMGGFEILEYRRFMFAPVSFLPYLHIYPPPHISLKLDKIIETLRLFNFLFVNQMIIGEKAI